MSAEIIPFPARRTDPLAGLGEEASTVLTLAALLVDLKRVRNLDEGIAAIVGRDRA